MLWDGRKDCRREILVNAFYRSVKEAFDGHCFRVFKSHPVSEGIPRGGEFGDADFQNA